MAPITPSSHTFQKLKLDTKTPQKPVASTFHSIPRHEPHQEGSLSSLLHSSSSDLSLVGFDYYSNGDNKRTEKGASGLQELACDGSAAAVGINDIEARFRQRQRSISFSNKVTLDCGNLLSLEDPLPKPLGRETVSESPNSEDDYSERAPFVEPPIDGLRHIDQHAHRPRYHSMATPTNGQHLAYSDQEAVASLTSAATASPLLDEVQTPPSPSTEYMLSPIPTASPIEYPFSFPRRNDSTTRTYRSDVVDGDSIARRSGRRASTRSGRSLSSMSPAASFLSRYKASDRPLKPTEPDDEGQGIGYHGEYIIGKQIGFGGFSVVKEVTTIEDNTRVVHAVKIVRKQLNDKSEMENEQIQTRFDHEVEIWRFLRHPYILPLLRVYNTEFATFCITRLNKGGTLFDLVRDTRRKQRRGIPLPLAKRYTYQLASAMRYLHNDVMVVHRDIKLENCLVDMTVPNAETDGGDILLCDFGMADFIISDQRDGPEPHSVGDNQNIGPADTSTSVAGSLQYAAPELFNAPTPLFSSAADIWAFGVVVFALLTAQLPFNEGLDAKTSAKIQSGDWDADLVRDSEALQDGAEEALMLLRGCLEMRPERRWTVNDVLNCKWLQGCVQQYEHVDRPWTVDP